MHETGPTLSPADEYEARIASRRDRATALIRRMVYWCVCAQMSIAAMCATGGFAASVTRGGEQFDIGILFAMLAACAVVAWLSSLVLAALTAIFVVLDWSLLSPGIRVLGFVPWSIILLELTPILLALATWR